MDKVEQALEKEITRGNCKTCPKRFRNLIDGESKAGKKIIGAIESENLNLVDIDNMIFMGTSLTRGTAVAMVAQTGMKTQLGNIANLVAEVKEEETPLQKQRPV